MTDPRQKLNEASETLRRAVENGDVREADADAILEVTAAYDEQDMNVTLPSQGEHAEDTTYKEASTLKYWCVYLKRVAERMDVALTDATAADVNDLMTAMRKGAHPDVKDEGLSNNSIRNYQGVVRRFYRYHDFGPAPEDIVMIMGDDTHVDERDMLTPEEIDRIRDAAEHPRDLAIFDLLLYTGQRNTAIRSLRIRDVDVEEGVYYLNGDADGLKGANENGTKRPLLGAVGSVREWLRYHPDSDNPDAYLITGKPRYSDVDSEQMVSRNTLLYAMKGTGDHGGLKQKAGIDKPMNPHNIRHNFVTIAKREYELSDATIKWLIGHSPDSQVMETTYAHLSDEDRIRAAEVGAGIREPDAEDKSLSPDICHCGEPLPSDARACPRCGTVYAPDAQAVKQQADSDLWDDKSEAEGDEEEAVDELKRLLDDNPGLLDELTERAE
jgi:integrase